MRKKANEYEEEEDGGGGGESLGTAGTC